MKKAFEERGGGVTKVQGALKKLDDQRKQATALLEKDLLDAWRRAIKHVEQEVLDTADVQALAVRNLRRVNASGLRRYAPGQQLQVLIDGNWHNVTVASESLLTPRAQLPLAFALSGSGAELYRVGNGDPRDLGSFTAAQRTTFRGRALAVLRPTATGVAGQVKLSATTPGLSAASVVVHIDAAACQ